MYDIHNGCSKCPPFAAIQARRRLGPTPFLHLSAGWGISSPRTRDGRAADTHVAGFHTSVAVAAQQSRSKSSGLCCMGSALGASLHGECPDCGEVTAAHYRRMRTPRPGVSSTTQRSSGVSASVLVSLQTAHIWNICCECCTAFAVNAEFFCHINRCSALK